MTTTKNYIRKTAWFTSNGLPDPRLERPETKLSLNVDDLWHKFKKMLGTITTGIPRIRITIEKR